MDTLSARAAAAIDRVSAADDPPREAQPQPDAPRGAAPPQPQPHPVHPGSGSSSASTSPASRRPGAPRHVIVAAGGNIEHLDTATGQPSVVRTGLQRRPAPAPAAASPSKQRLNSFLRSRQAVGSAGRSRFGTPSRGDI
mmetsp:Transcript_3408/g.14058  ORF Transcript_3408/g.14058 Transcript_3408/m.14058 type:complete len:139 (+) Transcript_3408:1042-1458(+)